LKEFRDDASTVSFDAWTTSSCDPVYDHPYCTLGEALNANNGM